MNWRYIVMAVIFSLLGFFLFGQLTYAHCGEPEEEPITRKIIIKVA